MSNSNLLSISEYLDITNLSLEDFINMLQEGELKFTADSNGALLVDISSLTASDIANRKPKKQKELSKEDLALIEEIIASEITTALDEIIKESVDLATSWGK